jgi:hypothetical protein
MRCVALRGRALRCRVPRVCIHGGRRVLGVPVLVRCRSVPSMCRVALLSGSCTCSGAVARVGPSRARGAVLSMSGVITLNACSAGGWRVHRLRRVPVPGMRIHGASMASMRIGCRSMACVRINGIRDSAVSRRIRQYHGFRHRIGPIGRATRGEREARQHRSDKR